MFIHENRFLTITSLCLCGHQGTPVLPLLLLMPQRYDLLVFQILRDSDPSSRWILISFTNLMFIHSYDFIHFSLWGNVLGRWPHVTLPVEVPWCSHCCPDEPGNTGAAPHTAGQQRHACSRLTSVCWNFIMFSFVCMPLYNKTIVLVQRDTSDPPCIKLGVLVSKFTVFVVI